VVRFAVRVEPGTFRLREYQEMLVEEAPSIAAFRARQSAAFSTERAAWEAAGEFEPRPEAAAPPEVADYIVPANGTLVSAPMTSSVWKITVQPGEQVVKGQTVVIVEAMKTETSVLSPCNGVIVDIMVSPGVQVHTGAPLVVVGSL
jgi:urea carboxylase